jgi:hypothetical protein
MSGIFHFLSSSLFGGTRKTDNNKKTPAEKSGGTLDTPERRAATNALIVDAKSISERKTISLGASLSRIWTRLKYDSELRKAASDCGKFLASLSSPDFDLSTIVPLCRPLGDIGGGNVKDFYEKKINDTIKKFATEAGKNGQPERIKKNLEKFDSGRQKSCNSPYRMALAYRSALESTKSGSSLKETWSILSKQPEKQIAER